jgi:undecaprenyl-diphosphatase
MPTLLCAGQFLCEPVYYTSAYLPFLLAVVIPITLFIMGRRKQAYLSALTIVSSAALSEGLKYVFSVPRPFPNIDSSPGFPSSHASVSFSGARILRHNKVLFALGLAFAAFVSFGRVYTGFHTWQDVIAGAVLGYALGEVIMRIGKKHMTIRNEKQLRKRFFAGRIRSMRRSVTYCSTQLVTAGRRLVAFGLELRSCVQCVSYRRISLRKSPLYADL